MSKKRSVIVLTGPTAVGKTELSIGLAKAIGGEIISADSIQVYKYMDIGSAKIKPEEMQGIKHYLVDELMPDDDFNIFRFKQLTLKYMDEIYAKGKVPIIVGGTGFYIQSVIYDIDFTQNETDTKYRKELEDIALNKGPEYVHDMLRSVDEKSANQIHYNNVKRVIRALEYFKDTGKKLSEHNAEQMKHESPYTFNYFVLNNHRDILYDRINKRVDAMIKDGLVDEVKGLLDMGYGKELVSMQGLGYKEIVDYLFGNISLDDAVYLIKRDTRHFAKRQLTWFRREKQVTWVNYFDYNSKQEMLNFMISEYKNTNNI